MAYVEIAVNKNFRIDLCAASGIFRVMNTTEQIADKLGRDAIAARVHVRRPAVDVAVRQGVFPASWYAALCDMTKKRLPLHLFSFKGMEKEAAE